MELETTYAQGWFDKRQNNFKQDEYTLKIKPESLENFFKDKDGYVYIVIQQKKELKDGKPQYKIMQNNWMVQKKMEAEEKEDDGGVNDDLPF